MLKTVLTIAAILVIAIAGGTASAWYALQTVDGLGALEIGVWTAYPDRGTRAADPYSVARAAREAELPLGRSEGLEFVARRDSAGAPLLRECTYRIEGANPPARFFTLHVEDEAGRVVVGRPLRAPGVHSYDMLWLDEDRVSIHVGAAAAPGNWLALSGSGPMRLVLTLHDTSVAGANPLAAVELPRVVGTGCPR